MKKTTKKIIGFTLLALLGGCLFFVGMLLWFMYINLDLLSVPTMGIGFLLLGTGIFEAGETYDKAKARKRKAREKAKA